MPPAVACSLTCDGITERGRMSDFIMKIASLGPSVTVSLMFSTTRFGR